MDLDRKEMEAIERCIRLENYMGYARGFVVSTFSTLISNPKSTRDGTLARETVGSSTGLCCRVLD